MSFIISMVDSEKTRIEYMIEKYSEELKTLPKGTISEKKSGNKVYCYLKYREGKKIVSKYIPQGDLEEFKEYLQRRKHIEIMLKSLKKELKIANKMLGAEI